MTDAFWLPVILGGLGVALMAGPLGCFILWRRMAYFGDAVGHSALLGVAISLWLQMEVTLGILLSAALMALGLAAVQRQSYFSVDTWLGVLAHAALSAGILLAVLSDQRIDLNAYLFGDILAVGYAETAIIVIMAALVLSFLRWRWRALLMLSLHPDIAKAEGMPVERDRLFLTLIMALAVAVSIPLAGALLITSLLIIPAAASRYLAASPAQMICLSAGVAVAAVAGGLLASFQGDAPSGPSIVLTACGLLAASAGLAHIRRRSP